MPALDCGRVEPEVGLPGKLIEVDSGYRGVCVHRWSPNQSLEGKSSQIGKFFLPTIRVAILMKTNQDQRTPSDDAELEIGASRLRLPVFMLPEGANPGCSSTQIRDCFSAALAHSLQV